MLHLPLAVALFAQTVSKAGQHHGVWHAVTGWIAHAGQVVSDFAKPLGVWGLAALALLDSALIPLPGGLIGWVVFYVAADHKNFVLCAFVTAFCSTVGSLLPYYVGRLGGEQFLLKKINRERYERMRDRFERQEFLAIMLPAMSPPPVPLKLFEFCAGVFEMRVRSFLLALFMGKFIQFLIVAIFAYRYGTAARGILEAGIHNHARGLLMLLGLLALVIFVWVVRRIFDRRRGTPLPIEEEGGVVVTQGGKTIVEE